MGRCMPPSRPCPGRRLACAARLGAPAGDAWEGQPAARGLGRAGPLLKVGEQRANRPMGNPPGLACVTEGRGGFFPGLALFWRLPVIFYTLLPLSGGAGLVFGQGVRGLRQPWPGEPACRGAWAGTGAGRTPGGGNRSCPAQPGLADGGAKRCAGPRVRRGIPHKLFNMSLLARSMTVTSSDAK